MSTPDESKVPKETRALFHASLDAKRWISYMNALTPLVEEATFNAAPEGLRLCAMDPSHISLVEFQLDRELFQDYECKQPGLLCIDIADLLKLLRRVAANEQLALEVAEPANDKLALTVTGKYVRRITLPLLQWTSGEAPKPKIQFTAEIGMEAAILTDIISDIEAAGSDIVKVDADSERITFEGKSEWNTADAQLEKGHPSILDYKVESPTKAMYGTKFLQDLVAALHGVSKTVTVNFATDKPVKLAASPVTYYLAPRLD